MVTVICSNHLNGHPYVCNVSIRHQSHDSDVYLRQQSLDLKSCNHLIWLPSLLSCRTYRHRGNGSLQSYDYCTSRITMAWLGRNDLRLHAIMARGWRITRIWSHMETICKIVKKTTYFQYCQCVCDARVINVCNKPRCECCHIACYMREKWRMALSLSVKENIAFSLDEIKG